MPNVFVSYSWDSPAHKAWVKKLAVDLRHHDIAAKLDQLDVQLGDDFVLFMEQGVASADFILLICTENFGSKANARRDGVGYENSIVTSELLRARSPRGRIVCVLREGTPSTAIPRYMQNRRWLDASRDAEYADVLQQLIEHVTRGSDDSSDVVETATAATADGATQQPTAPGRPELWALVAGTGVRRGFSPELETAARSLGTKLQGACYGLVTGGWPGVDEWVARAFADAAIAHHAPLEDALIQILPRRTQPAFPAGQLIFVSSTDGEWSEPVRRADVVIVLGGLGGTKSTAKIALDQQKRLLPIPQTGGYAYDLYLSMLKRWSELSWMGMSEREFSKLSRPGDAGIDAAIELAAAR